jgi:acetoacetyl-CoA synthetase
MELSMDRFHLADAPSCTNVAAGRIRIYKQTSDRPAISQLTAFTAALQVHTGKAFENHQALHDFSVRDFRTFWGCFVEWSQGLEVSGSIEPVCVGEACEHACFFPDVQFNYAANLLSLSVAPALHPRSPHVTRIEYVCA